MRTILYIAVFTLILSFSYGVIAEESGGNPGNLPVQRYSIVTGVKYQDASSMSLTRPMAVKMKRINIELNNKLLVVQFGGDELYIKLTDSFGNILYLEKDDLTVVSAIAQKISESKESNEDLLKALEVLYSWPENLPVYLWKDAVESISPLNDHVFVVKSPGKTKIKQQDQFYELTDSDLIDKLDRKFPQIDTTKEAIKGSTVSPSLGSPSLCKIIGQFKPATYPDNVTIMPPSVTWKTTEPKKIRPWWKIETSDCSGRCGKGCSGVLTGFKSNSDVYSTACFNHDYCAVDKGLTSLECNYIFADAAADYIKSNCSKLIVEGPSSITDNSSTDYITSLVVGGVKINRTYNSGTTWTLLDSISSSLVYPIDTQSIRVKDLPNSQDYATTIKASFSRHGLTRVFKKNISITTP